jgi:hypothetical protein
LTLTRLPGEVEVTGKKEEINTASGRKDEFALRCRHRDLEEKRKKTRGKGDGIIIRIYDNHQTLGNFKLQQSAVHK